MNTGINAEENVPKTKTSKTRSGSLKAAKNKESSPAPKKCAKTLWRTNPKTLEATTISIIIVAAERTEVWAEKISFFPFEIIFPTIVF